MHYQSLILTALLGASNAYAQQFAQYGNTPSYSVSTYNPSTATSLQASTTYTTVTTSVCTQAACTKSSTYTTPAYTPPYSTGKSSLTTTTPYGTGKPSGSGNGTVPTYTSPRPSQYTGGASGRMAGSLGGVLVGAGLVLVL